jgi:hypothetical protein
MSDPWTTISVADVRVGDRIRHRGEEFDVARIDSPFLGMDSMVCLIEDTAERWRAHPAAKSAEVEVSR